MSRRYNSSDTRCRKGHVSEGGKFGSFLIIMEFDTLTLHVSVVPGLPTPSPVSGFTQRMAANEVHKHPTMGEHQSSDPAYHPTVLPPTEKAGYMIPEKYLKMMPWMIGLMVMLFFGMIGMMVMEYYEHENEHKEESVKKMAPRNP